MNRPKNIAHRPSQSDQQYVKRKDGTKVINTAYKGNHSHNMLNNIHHDMSGDFFHNTPLGEYDKLTPQEAQEWADRVEDYEDVPPEVAASALSTILEGEYKEFSKEEAEDWLHVVETQGNIDPDVAYDVFSAIAKENTKKFTHPMFIAPPPKKSISTQYCHDISQYALDNLKYPDVIASTVAGSLLYGTAHEDSDVDIIVIRTGEFSHGRPPKNEHIIVDGVDVTVWNLQQYIKSAENGSAQAMEIYYSPYLKIKEDNPYTPLMKSMRISPFVQAKKMRSLAKAYYLQAMEMEDGYKKEKYLRHAQRSYEAHLNILEGNEYNPVFHELGTTSQPVKLYDIPQWAEEEKENE